MKKFIFAFSVSLLVLTACDPADILVQAVERHTVVGSGQIINEDRDIAEFSSVDVSGSMNVRISRGERARCTVEGDDNIVPLVKTEVHGGKLKVFFERGVSIHRDVNVYLEVPLITRVSLSGSGDIDITDVTRDEVSLEIDGSGDISATGEVGTLSVEIDGSGNMRLFDLHAARASVEINGSGDVQINAGESLDCEINGSGDIRYAGNPESVRKTVRGSGSISRTAD